VSNENADRGLLWEELVLPSEFFLDKTDDILEKTEVDSDCLFVVHGQCWALPWDEVSDNLFFEMKK
jgi:hypothetical protein